MNKEIENLLKEISKDFSGDLMLLDNIEKIDAIPFGIKSLDEITGCGGVPMGRITEIYGAESGGKTSLCLALIAQAQKTNLRCAFIDMELSMTKELATKMGVDMAQLIYARPLTGEDALALVDKLLEHDVKLIVVDSVSSLVPEGELEADFDKDSIGLQARMMSKAMRKLLGTVKTNNAALVFVNQIRDDIGKMGFGPKTTTSGGRALKFYSSLRLEVARTGWITKGDAKVGLHIKVTTKKNKMSRPQLSTEFDFYFENGLDMGSDLLNYNLNNGTLREVGRKYYEGDKLIGDKEETIKHLLANVQPVDKSPVDNG
jgi:recombination protein RecA